MECHSYPRCDIFLWGEEEEEEGGGKEKAEEKE
jgi:hypothetical protein